MRGAGAIDQLPSGRWRLRVPLNTGARATYGAYVTEELAVAVPAVLVQHCERARCRLGVPCIPGGERRH